jgi:ribosomal silencing factor RsfS
MNKKKKKLNDYFVYMTQTNFGRNKRTMKNKRKKYQKVEEKGDREREKAKRKWRL